MADKIDWDSMAEFNRHEKLKLPNVKDMASIEFVDEGSFVPKRILAESGSQYPRDSYVFVLKVKSGDLNEFWIGANNYSLMNNLKALREGNGGKLQGLRATITRISTELTETNFEIKKV